MSLSFDFAATIESLGVKVSWSSNTNLVVYTSSVSLLILTIQKSSNASGSYVAGLNPDPAAKIRVCSFSVLSTYFSSAPPLPLIPYSILI